MKLATVASLAALIAASWQPVVGQGPSTRAPSPARRDLEAMAQRAESLALASTEAAERDRQLADVRAMRLRLTEGDFQVGDRIVLRVASDSTLPDTVTVRAGPVLPLGDYGDVPLRGVLRQELVPHLTTALSRYIRTPHVEALTLVRVAVVGWVMRPGYYHIPADALMSDLVMLAGGPSTEGDLTRISVRRDASELITIESVRGAVAAGRTVTDLGLRAGDEVMIGERKRRSIGAVAQILSLLTAVTLGVIAIAGSGGS